MENAEDTLYEAMGEREFKTAVGVVDFPPLPSTDVSFFVSYKLARDNGPNLLIAQDMIEQLKLDALRAKMANLPQLNVTGGAGWTDTEHSYASANNNLWPGPGYNWNAGASFSIPLGMRSTKAALRQARDAMNSEQVTYDQTDQQLIVQVRTDVRAVSAAVESVTAATEAEALSQKQYDLQKAKFDAGLATTYDTLQAEITLETSRVALIQSQVNLRLALANLHFLEGTTLAAYHVNLN